MMAYNKTTWENLPSTATPITAANLNKIETGIEALGTWENITSQCTFNTGISRAYGGIYLNRVLKLLRFQIALSSTVTNGWYTHLTLPSDVRALVENGSEIAINTDFWTYSNGDVRGGATAGESKSLYGTLIIQ